MAREDFHDQLASRARGVSLRLHDLATRHAELAAGVRVSSSEADVAQAMVALMQARRHAQEAELRLRASLRSAALAHERAAIAHDHAACFPGEGAAAHRASAQRHRAAAAADRRRLA
ncbi:hypothetical protein Lesp02_39360 [Lentzea sp. NBRC 105346]|nr:hypothetical protein Lesp02_39360 [Lentzea sp. NBRC 105346]